METYDIENGSKFILSDCKPTVRIDNAFCVSCSDCGSVLFSSDATYDLSKVDGYFVVDFVNLLMMCRSRINICNLALCGECNNKRIEKETEKKAKKSFFQRVKGLFCK